MPKFTIETTYDLPVFRHRTYEASDALAACALALADDNWEGAKQDYETCGETTVTGVWDGEDAAYMGKSIPLPVYPKGALTAAAPDMLAALKRALPFVSRYAGGGIDDVAKAMRAAIAKAEGREG